VHTTLLPSVNMLFEESGRPASAPKTSSVEELQRHLSQPTPAAHTSNSSPNSSSSASAHAPTANGRDNIELATGHDHVDHCLSPVASDFRRIRVNRRLQEAKFKRNSISTSKYNPLTFLPKFLFEQFQKYSNIFFFFIVALQVIFCLVL